MDHINISCHVSEYVAKGGEKGILDSERFEAMRVKGDWKNITQDVHQVGWILVVGTVAERIGVVLDRFDFLWSYR